MKKNRKINLSLDKEVISSLSGNEMGNVMGGVEVISGTDCKSLQNGFCYSHKVSECVSCIGSQVESVCVCEVQSIEKDCIIPIQKSIATPCVISITPDCTKPVQSLAC